MIKAFFKTVFYKPLYNGLIFLIDILPGIDLGVAIILFTILVRLILFPLSRQSVKTQLKMRQIEPLIAASKEKHKNSRDEQARDMLRIYKENDLHPLSGVLLMLIQLPILISLYVVFSGSGLPTVHPELLYSFVKMPENISVIFLGFIDLLKPNFIFAVLAAVTQFLQIRFSMPPPAAKKENATFQEDLARSMNFQMRYFMPILIFIFALRFSAALSLYWIVSNLFTIAQELYLRGKFKSQPK